jgi:hypothetical protein
MPSHPCRPIHFDHANDCDLRTLEDSTMVADRDRAAVLGGTFERASTPTERTLLAVFNTTAPTTLVTYVYVTTSVRRRTFPDLTALPT